MRPVRPRNRLGPRAASDEAGFTLVELLVVMLILGVLAAIALPAFSNQRSKAGDAKAKVAAHTAQVAMETYATSNGGGYENATAARLKEIEPVLNTEIVTLAGPEGSGNPSASGYQVKITATTGDTFSVRRNAGAITFPCSVASASNRGGCPGSGAADGFWN